MTRPRFRFAVCGEYGDQNDRPHYHALVFGIEPKDSQFYKNNDLEQPLFVSKTLEEIWGKGRVWHGALTFESAAYVARYCLKKISGPAKAGHYKETLDLRTGELFYAKTPEFFHTSRRPGLAMDWLKKYGADVWTHDHIVSRGKSMLPPRAFLKALEKLDPFLADEIREKRKMERRPDPKDKQARLEAREFIKNQKVKNLLKRKL